MHPAAREQACPGRKGFRGHVISNFLKMPASICWNTEGVPTVETVNPPNTVRPHRKLKSPGQRPVVRVMGAHKSRPALTQPGIGGSWMHRSPPGMPRSVPSASQEDYLSQGCLDLGPPEAGRDLSCLSTRPAWTCPAVDWVQTLASVISSSALSSDSMPLPSMESLLASFLPLPPLTSLTLLPHPVILPEMEALLEGGSWALSPGSYWAYLCHKVLTPPPSKWPESQLC